MTFIRRLISPVFMKEMTQFSGSKRNYLLKCLFMVISILIVLCVGLEEQSGLGDDLCMTASMIGIITILFAVPVMTAGLVSSEVESKTLPLLFLTHLSPWNIAQDKALSRLAQMSYIICLLVPIYACGMLFGGVSWLQVLASCAYLIGTIFLSAGVSILCGVICKSLASALFISYTMIIGICYGPFFLAYVISASERLMVMRFCPFAIAGLYNSKGCWEWTWYLGYSGLVYLTGVAMAAWKIRSMKRQGMQLAVIRRFSNGLQRLRDFFAFIYFPEQSGTCPLFWRDRQVAPFLFAKLVQRFIWAMILIVPFVAGLFAAADEFFGVSTYKDDDVVGFLLGCSLFLGSMSIIIYGAMCIAREKRSQTFPILLATGVGGRALAWGYLKTGLWLMVDVLLMQLVCLASFVAIDENEYGYFCWMVALFIAFVSAVTVLVGVRLVNTKRPLHNVGQGVILGIKTALFLVSLAYAYCAGSDYSWFGSLPAVLITYFFLVFSIWLSATRRSLKGSVGLAVSILLALHILPGLFVGFTHSPEILGAVPYFSVIGGHMVKKHRDSELILAIVIGILTYGTAALFFTCSLLNDFDKHVERVK